MHMTVGLFEAFVAEMQSIEAERVLDMARASVAQFQKSDWWDTLSRQAHGDRPSSAAAASTGAALGFVFNGTPMSFDALHANLARAIPGGVSA